MSKNSRSAIRYTRVSSDEQAKGFSLTDQAELIEKHARSRGIKLVASFQDDFSAKTRAEIGESFNRPGFSAMLAWIRANRGAADLLLFKDWSRFSRDATDALVMIRQLEAMGIECQAVEQPIDWSVPEQVPLLMLYLGMPEAENRRRSLNIRRGIRQAVREGRWVTKAPTGYRRAFDQHGKSYLEPDPEAAALVVEAFELVAGGMPVDAARKEMRRKARQRGLSFYSSPDAFYEMLRNRAYLGQVFLKAWKDEPAQWLEGRHEAIISPRLFEHVQRALGERSGGEKRVLRDELPLRGHLLDPATGERLTGSGSKSRNGSIFWYYHSQPNRARDAGVPVYRVRADVAHEAFEEYLAEIAIAPEVANAFGLVLEDALDEHNRTARAEVARLEKRRREVEEKLFKTDEAFIEGRIAGDSYERLKRSYTSELAEITLAIEDAGEISEGVKTHLEFGLRLMSNLDQAWRHLPSEGKHVLVGSIWPSGVVFENGSYRTTPKSDLLYLLSGKNPGTSTPQKNRKSGVVLPEFPVRWS